jgi:hypothetical protein
MRAVEGALDKIKKRVASRLSETIAFDVRLTLNKVLTLPSLGGATVFRCDQPLVDVPRDR